MDSNGIVRVAPTLIVGFGGTGSLGVQYAKRKIRKELQQLADGREVPQKLPFIEYVVLDTTAQEEFVEDLPGDEYVNLGHVNVPRLIRYVDGDPTLRQALNWFPRHINPGQIDSGARGVRHIGRLCFFNRLPQVENAIRDKIQTITNRTLVDRMLKEECDYLTVDAGSTIDVHLISSLCGGTGSACLLDAAYLIKNLVNEILEQGTNSSAHLVCADAFVGDKSVNASSREYIKYNFAVSLAEIERFMNFEVTLSGSTAADGHGRWKVKYLDGREISSVEKPFSLAYLLGYKEGETISKKHLCEIIGDAIALSTIHPENHQLKGLLDNPKAHVVTQKNSVGKVKAYSSYNIRTITAEFNEQTLKASSFLACEVILEAILNGAEVNYDEMLIEITKDMVSQFQDGFAMRLSQSDLSRMCDHIEGLLGINTDKFNDTNRRIIKLGNKKQWFRKQREGVIRDQIHVGQEGYELRKLELKEQAQQIASEVKAWLVDVRVKLINKIYTFLEDGRKLTAVVGCLERLSEDLKAVAGDLAAWGNELKLPESKEDAWLKNAILRKKYPEDAVLHMRDEVLRPLFDRLEIEISELEKYAHAILEKCLKTGECLRQAKSLVKEQRARSYSFTESSLWTREKVSGKLKEDAIIKMLVKGFIRSLQKQHFSSDRRGEKGLEFLWHLDPHEQEDAKRVVQTLHDVAREVVETNVHVKEINFNPDENVNGQATIVHEELHRLVELAAPTWQIERAGEDITQIGITNCPEQTKVGRLISRLGHHITFTESNRAPNNIVIFRSEHGVTADRLLRLDDCVAAMKRRLKVEEKSHIKELSLDPEWNIDLPGSAFRIEQMLARFSLGAMFGLINEKEFKAYFFRAKGKKRTVLSQSPDPALPAERAAAFSRFLLLRSNGNRDLMDLIDAIEAQWQARRDAAIMKFKQQVLTYIQELSARKANAFTSENVSNEDELSQWDQEIDALQREVIRPLEMFIKNDRDGGKPAAQGHASGR